MVVFPKFVFSSNVERAGKMVYFLGFVQFFEELSFHVLKKRQNKIHLYKLIEDKGITIEIHTLPQVPPHSVQVFRIKRNPLFVTTFFTTAGVMFDNFHLKGRLRWLVNKNREIIDKF